MTILLTSLLVVNMVWFGAGAWQFGLRSKTSSFGLVANSDVTPRGREGVAGSLRFLGGLNLSLAALTGGAIIHRNDFGPSSARLVLATLAIAHLSQFAVNLPFAWQERRGREGAWPVDKGVMRIIFYTDGLLGVIDSTALATLVFPCFFLLTRPLLFS